MIDDIIGELQLVYNDNLITSKPIYVSQLNIFNQEVSFLSKMKSLYGITLYKPSVIIRKIITKKKNEYYRKNKFYLFEEGDNILIKDEPPSKKQILTVNSDQ